ncbi:MAG: hypothetical protein PVJ60_04640, partial [Phycisphaerales bacterium]
MEPITEPEINLFDDELPILDQIKVFSEHIHSSEANMLAFGKQVESNLGSSSQKTSLTTGIGLYILGRYTEAIDKLQKATDCKEKFIYLAFSHRKTREYESAIENLQKSLDYEADTLGIS